MLTLLLQIRGGSAPLRPCPFGAAGSSTGKGGALRRGITRLHKLKARKVGDALAGEWATRATPSAREGHRPLETCCLSSGFLGYGVGKLREGLDYQRGSHV